MKKLPLFSVSCFNQDTGEPIYHDQLVNAENETEARFQADAVQRLAVKKFNDQVNVTGNAKRRYDITAVKSC